MLNDDVLYFGCHGFLKFFSFSLCRPTFSICFYTDVSLLLRCYWLYSSDNGRTFIVVMFNDAHTWMCAQWLRSFHVFYSLWVFFLFLSFLNVSFRSLSIDYNKLTKPIQREEHQTLSSTKYVITTAHSMMMLLRVSRDVRLAFDWKRCEKKKK